MDTLAQLLSELFSVSIWFLSIGLIVGGITGLIIGIIKQRIKIVLFPAILGSFLGTLTIAFVPLFSIPGLVNGGAYAGVFVLGMLIVLVPIGSITGGIVGGLSSLQMSPTRQRRIFRIAIPLGYLFLIMGILLRVVVFKAG
ncbi:hypothetical protein IQ219_08610 [Synechocystis sp. LEGE 06083]|uniref:hypothetical protein n=1 Tax=Synechocystis sp. LEGE 06083 TaxID=915336 RepID=UPI00187E2F69|nr:hypothetical protein [Synechocystis sp. LEGE 06083]MBE9195364.1 hypothetical protein [Synechocystis sp. LEGE 06083]